MQKLLKFYLQLYNTEVLEKLKKGNRWQPVWEKIFSADIFSSL